MKKIQIWVAKNPFDKEDIENDLFLTAPEDADKESIFQEANLSGLFEEYPINRRFQVEFKESVVEVALISPSSFNSISFEFFKIGSGIATS